jgi:hypothetical protein
MPTNEELIQKGTIVADDLAAAGKLNPWQANRFIDYVFDETFLRNIARTVKFKPESAKIDKIGVGRRVAMAKKSATDPGKRRKVTTSAIELTPREIIVPFEIEDAFKEINIEGDNVEDHIIKMMATQSGNDVEEMSIRGDKVGEAALEGDLFDQGSTTRYIKDEFLALVDGWIRRADGGHIVDAAGTAIESSIFGDMIKALPHKFSRDRSKLKFYCSPTLEQEYREKVSTRLTATGDAALMSKLNLTPYGIELVPVPLWPDYPIIVEDITLTGTGPHNLRYNNLPTAGSFVVTTNTLGEVPEEAYAETTDYTINRTNGTISRVGGGTITDGQTVKVTYESGPQVILTHRQNLIVAISRDVRIEKDRNIFRTVNEYAITLKTDVNIEEVDALAKAVNIG